MLLFFSVLARQARAQTNQTLANGQSTAPLTFPAGGCVYNWVNDHPSIGLAASGTGDIPSFTAINTGSSPVTATITATPVNLGLAYIADGGYGANSVSVIDIAAQRVTATIPVGANPLGVAVNHAGTFAYVGSSGNESISVINTATNLVTATIPVNGEAADMVMSADDSKLYVIDYPYITVINTRTNTVMSNFTLGNYITPTGIALSPDGSKLYIANATDNDILVVNAATNAITATILVGYNPFGIALSPDGSRLYVPFGVRTIYPDVNKNDTLKIINTSNNAIIAAIPVGQGADMVALNNNGSLAYVINGFANTISVVNTASYQVVATIPVGNGPSGLALTADGSELLIENDRDDNVSVINTATNTVTATIPTGADPDSYGNFITPGAGCNGTITFQITVNPTPAVTAGPVTGEIAACAGSASASPELQQFSVTGNNLTGPIQLTAPAGFQISLSPAGVFTNDLSILPAGGKVVSTTVYVRSAASSTGNIAGRVVITSQNVPSLYISVSGTINDLLTTNAVPDQTVMNGQFTNAVDFTGTAGTVNWTNNATAIGLPATGTGDIAAFKAINLTPNPVVATITATPAPAVYAYINNSGDGTVSVINAATHAVLKTITVGATPVGVATSPDGTRVYIENEDSNTISVISTATNSVIATIPVGLYARGGMVVSPDGSTLYLATFGGNNVLAINTISNTITATIPVGQLPLGIAVSPDGGKVYVGNFEGGGKINVINTSTNTVSSSITVAPGNSSLAIMDVMVSPDGAKLYAVTQSPDMVYTIDAATGNVLASVSIGRAADCLAISPDGKVLYATSQDANTVTVINSASDQVVAIIPVSAGPVGIAVSPDGSQALVTSPAAVAVINTNTNTVSSSFQTGTSPHSFGSFIINGANCPGTPTQFTILVNPSPPPVISFTGSPAPLHTQYGTPSASISFSISGLNLDAGVVVTPPPGFEVSGDNISFAPSVTIGAAGMIIAVPFYIRLAAITHAGTYAGNIQLSSSYAANVEIGMPASTVSPAPLTITADNVNKSYGIVLSGISGSTAFTSSGLQNNETIASVWINYGQGAAATAAVGAYPASVNASTATGGTFSPADYSLSYIAGNITVVAVPLTITADNKVKGYGTLNPALTVSYSGFVNGEGPQQLTEQPIITTLATQNSPVGQYPIMVSGAIAANYAITYIPGLLTVTPNSDAGIVIPNTFTPNGDNINDKWVIDALTQFPKCTVSIFTRYGTLIFYSIGYGQPWDGTYHNSPLPAGTYYYIIKIIAGNGINNLSGPVTIIR